MRIFFSAALAAVASFTILSPASAADWTGCYSGVNLGVSRATSTATDLPFQEGPYAGMGVGWNTAYDRVKADGSGVAGGLVLGCEQQIAPLGKGAFVLGGVLDASVMNTSGEATFQGAGRDTSAAFKVKNAASLRVRAGYAEERALFYVTGGFARGQIDVSAHDDTPLAMMQVSGGGTKSGWVAGVGVEWALSDRHRLDISLLHYDFGKLTATGAATDPIGAFPRFQHDIKADVLRVGMNWRF